MIKKPTNKNFIRVTVMGLPLAGLILSSLLALSPVERQLLILILLLWFQAYFIFEVFMGGK